MFDPYYIITKLALPKPSFWGTIGITMGIIGKDTVSTVKINKFHLSGVSERAHRVWSDLVLWPFLTPSLGSQVAFRQVQTIFCYSALIDL